MNNGERWWQTTKIGGGGESGTDIDESVHVAVVWGS
jgi:hypothetical protein